MKELLHYIGDDLAVDGTGDLSLGSGTIIGQQRILRRLLTPLQAYIWHLDYGAGLPGVVGTTMKDLAIKALITSQMFNEQIVTQDPPPNIIITHIPNGISVRIQYVDNTTGQTIPISFD